MHLQLGPGSPQGRECRHRGNLPGLQVEPGTAVDISKGKFDEIAGKIGGNILQALYDPFAGLAVDFLQFLPAACEPLVVHAAFPRRLTYNNLVTGFVNNMAKMREVLIYRTNLNKA